MNHLKLTSSIVAALLIWPASLSAQTSPVPPAQVQTNPQQTIPQQETQESDSSQDDDTPSTDADSKSTDDQKSDSESKVKTTSKRRGFRANSKRSRDLMAAFEPAVSSTCDAVVRIMNDKKQIALGTIIDKQGFVLTKLSELRGKLKCSLPDGSSKVPQVIGIDPDTDLVLLKIEASDLAYVDLNDQPLPPVGAWVATLDQESVPLSVGIISHEARRIQRTELNSAVIGIFPENISDSDGVRVNFVVSDSPAESAGVLVNDVIIGIDDEKIINRAELLETLSHYQPGDKIVLKVQRDNEDIDFDVTLGKRRTNPMMDRGDRQNQLGSTLSKRRGDFPRALQHDSTLNANQCGGPLVDLDGNIVGINIARDGRVSSLALPNAIVIPVVEKLKTGKYVPAVVNKSEIRQIQRRLTSLEKEMGSLPSAQSEKKIEFSAGNALEKELERQVKEAEERLKKLQARLEKKKELNKVLVDELSELESKKQRIERRREPLQKDLKRLKTGIE